MRKILSIVFIVTISFSLTNCASIVTKSRYPISINSSPSEAKITITDRKGIDIYMGNTPAVVKLSSGNGFFKKAQYQVKFEKDGYQTKIVPVDFKVDGWYWGNILFGGLIGMLIIDPATGAMYKLDTEYLNETLAKSTNTIGLNVIEINDVPVELLSHLVLIEE